MVDDNENQEDKAKRRVVVTHYGKKKKEDEDVPSEIRPHEPTHILSSPVDIEAGSISKRSVPKQETRVEAEIKSPPFESVEPKPQPKINIPPREAEQSHAYAPEYSAQSTSPEYSAQTIQPGESDNMPPHEPPYERRTGDSGFSGVFSLLMLIAVIILGYFAFTMQMKISQIEQQNAQSKTNVLAIAEQAKLSLNKINEKQKQELQAQKELATLKTDVQNAQAQLMKVKKDSDWALAEANYMAFMANSRLKSAYDVPTALMQLQAADERLKDVGNPGLNWVREAIAKDIAKLKSLPDINRQAVWEQIQNINNAFYQLHFKRLDDALRNDQQTQNAKLAKFPAWRQALMRSWYEIKGLIRVTRQDKNSVPLALSMQEQSQILRTMQLLCQQAQWALMAGQNVIYQSSLKSLETSLSQYFEATPVQANLIKQVKDLSAQNIAIQSPDISNSVQALSQAILKQDGGKL